jgi:hypothetical protein
MANKKEWEWDIPKKLADEAKILVDDGENTEYLRGVCEILSVYPICLLEDKRLEDNTQRSIFIATQILGIKIEVARKMYY